ncbi:hypothetical protein VTO42DRAFT_4824 [Malbranchea cinnamomea]
MRQFQTLALGLASAGLAASALATETESDVISLGKDTFKDFIKEHELVLAEFFAPWCGHCKALAPEYEAAATELKDRNIPLVKVDCTEEADLCQEYGVQGYPTLKIFRGLDSIKPYSGARKSTAITSTMIRHSLPAISTVTSENLEDFKNLDKVVIVAYIGEDDKASNETYTSIAEKLRDDYLFGGTSDVSLAKAEEVDQPSIVLYKDFDERKDVFTDKFDADAIESFIKTASIPLVGVIGPETYASYISAGVPLAYIFAETQEERDHFATELKPLAKKLKGSINFATIDAKAFGAHAGNLNLDPEKFPAFAIQDTIANKRYPYDQAKKITEKDISQFVHDVLNGKIEPSIKSEPIPESQEGPVTVVVAHTYQELVIDNDKDVLLEFYAPWCGHCKALAPKYDELGALYANNPDFSSKVTIAKIDATNNDVPDEITGFPTIKLYPAGAKDSPVDYRGSRTVEDLANFVRDNGKHKVDAYTEKVKKDDAEKSETEPASQSSSEASTESDSSSSSKTAETTRHEEL